MTHTIAMRFRGRSSVLHMALPWEDSAIRILGFALVFLVIGYITLVSISIVNVIAHKEATDKAAALRTVVGGLEHDYFALSQGLTAESGMALGLTRVSNTEYVHVPGALSAQTSAGSSNGVRNEM